jgi:hypothetical protein
VTGEGLEAEPVVLGDLVVGDGGAACVPETWVEAGLLVGVKKLFPQAVRDATTKAAAALVANWRRRLTRITFTVRTPLAGAPGCTGVGTVSGP